MSRFSRLCGILMILALAMVGCKGDGIVAVDDQSARHAGSLVQSAANIVPLHAQVSLTIDTVPPFPPPSANSRLHGTGKAMPFGPFELSGSSQVDVTVLPFSQTLEMVFTFRNGDELYVTGTGNGVPTNPPGSTVFAGDLWLQGGTGRFENASGTAFYSGIVSETAGGEGTGQLTIDGNLSGFGVAGN